MHATKLPLHAQWARPAGLTNRKASVISGGFPWNKLNRPILQRLDLKEDDDEREQRERLDKRESKNQEDKDSRTCARVTRQRLGSRSGCLTLTQTAETGSDGHTQSGSQRNPLV